MPMAAWITSKNSRSAITTLASPCCSMKEMASASRRTLRVLSTAPIIGTPKCASSIAGMFGSITATVSPLPIPRPASAEARRRQRA